MANDFDQVHRAFDDSPQRFRDKNNVTRFSKASGVLFEQAMAQTRMAICLSDPKQPDIPIVFANRAFVELTGYEESEVIGQNCRFLQGRDTDPEQVARIREAIEGETVIVVELLNYRKDGSSFWNALHLGPIYDQDGELLYYFGSQWDVSDVHSARAEEAHALSMSRELSHRVKNMFAVISAIVNMTGRAHGITDAARTINDRLQALGRAYEPTLDDASLGSTEVGQAIRSVLGPFDTEDGRLEFHGNGLRVDPNRVSVVGLVIHELATNAVKYGALSNEAGIVGVEWRAGDNNRDIIIEWSERGGPAVSEPLESNGSGQQIIHGILRAANGDIAYEWLPKGLTATITVPIDDHGSAAA